MKRNRILLILLWLLSLVGISFYGGTISYGIFAMFTLIPVISLIYLLCVYLRFRIYQKLGTVQIVAKEAIPFYFILKNESFFAFAGIRVHFFSSFSGILGLEDGIEYTLFPGKQIERQTTLLCKYRGEYEVGIKNVEIQDFFRLFRWTYRNPETLRVIVKPKWIRLEKLDSLSRMLLAMKQRENQETVPDVLVREYIPGDDIRLMHWKSTALTGQLMLRKQTGETKSGIGVVLIPTRVSDKQTVYLPIENKALEILVAITGFLAEKKNEVRVLLGKNKGELRVTSLAGFDSLYQAASGVVFEDECFEAYMEEILHGNTLFDCKMVYFVATKWDEKIKNALQLLEKKQVPAYVYVVSAKGIEENRDREQLKAQVQFISPEDELGEVL